MMITSAIFSCEKPGQLQGRTCPSKRFGAVIPPSIDFRQAKRVFTL